MSANTVTELVTEELGREYKATLLQIKRNLTNDLQEELCFYYTADPAHAGNYGYPESLSPLLSFIRECPKDFMGGRRFG